MVEEQIKGDKLILTFSGGDKDKFEIIKARWKFKNSQSMLRFVVSLMFESRDKSIMGIVSEKWKMVNYTPADHLLLEPKKETFVW